MAKFYPLGRFIKRKKIMRRRKTMRRHKRANTNVGSGLVHTKKAVIFAKTVASSNTTAFGSQTFQLFDIPQYLSYTALYEEYKIDKIVFSLKALQNVSVGVTSTAANYLSTLGMIHSTVDYNDAVAPTTIQSMMNDSTYKGTVSSRNHTRTFVPRWLNDVASNVANQSKTGWLNTDTTSVSHYGVKWAFEGGYTNAIASAPSFVVEPIVTYYISFRNPK